MKSFRLQRTTKNYYQRYSDSLKHDNQLND